MSLVTRQSMADDTGLFVDGTEVDKAFVDQLYDQVDDQCHSSTNPTIKPKAVTDEVIAARGSKASLDARLDVALNDDGTPKAVAGQATQTQIGDSYGAGNWLANDDFLVWAAGDAVAPTGWTLTTLTCARAGTGLGDTNTKVGPFCVKLTRASSDGSLKQYLLNSTSMSASGAHLKSTTFGFGCWVKTSVSNSCRIRLYDGVTSGSSSYHTGDGTWQWLSGTHTLSGSATEITLILEVLNSSADGYFSGAVALPGSVAPTNWVPCPKSYGALFFPVPGTLTTGTDKVRFRFARPTLVKEVVLNCKTAPTTQAIIIDVNHYDGSSWTTMFSTRPQIAATATRGSAKPDATGYRYRCFGGGDGTTATDVELAFDIDQVGSGTVGADLFVMIRCLQYSRPQENLLDVADGF
jgi:hypothetical protein